MTALDTSSHSTKRNDYLLLFRGSDWIRTLSPEDLQTYLTDSMAWFERLTAQGRMKGGQPLTDEKRVLSAKAPNGILDGPYAESKEAIGGYVIVEAASMEEITEIARQCPCYNFGSIIEIRVIAEECPTTQWARERAAAATL